MPHPVWKDTTSYSQNDKDHVPRTWQLVGSPIKISVTRHIHYNKGDWVLICELFPARVISTGTVDEAKAAAVNHVRRYLKTFLQFLGE